MKVHARLLALILTMLVAPGAALAQTETNDNEEAPFISLGTDRPGNGNAATTVPHLKLQLETSGAYLFDKAGDIGIHQVSFPTMLRFGLFDIAELRVGSSIVGLDGTSGAEVVSSTDTSVGVKVQLWKNQGAIPDLSVMSDVFFPSGQNAFTSTVVVPEARFAAAWALPAGFGLLLNLGLDVPEDATSRYARLIQVVNLSYAFPFWQQRLSLFVESFGRTSLAKGRGPIQQIDAGVALMVGRKVQLDFFSQHGLTNNAPRLQLALGLSTRF